MAAESIIDLKKPGFPVVEENETGTMTRIEYIGDTTTIEGSKPAIGDAWGDYAGTVTSSVVDPTERADVSELTIQLELTKDNENAEPGELKSISYEIRWVTVERSLYEHPQFAIGGGGLNELSAADIAELQLWQSPLNPPSLRKDYKYEGADKYENELSEDSKLFARGIELGQEVWEDKAPIAVKISEYVKGPPPETSAGQKDDPVGFPNLPEGYEWRKETADSTRDGGQTRWTLTEEWLGAKKVLIDRDQIFWTPPA